MNKKIKMEPMEEGILRAMQAVDNQIAREMQRTPAERDEHGVQKWEPYLTRVERIVPFILNNMGDEEIDLDSLLVFTQSFIKSLRLYIEDLGPSGLGKIRQAYCFSTLEKVERDIRESFDILKSSNEKQHNLV